MPINFSVLNFLAILFFLYPVLTASTALAAPRKYLGVASCASSNCHGSAQPRSSTNVMQNEYVTWFRHGAHAKAWKTLTSKDSQQIARHLGLKSATGAKICLDCHATNVPQSQRGPKFRIQDGVGCESCHGPSSDWIASHKAATATHADNVKRGLLEIVPLKARNEMCLTCHLGTDDKTVDHRLIGAGHPRLGFELDTFSLIQPNHWSVDADYVKRKSRYNSAKAWFVGQVSRASEMVEAMLSAKRSKMGAMPELALFYCYSCHHSLKEDQWKSRDYGGEPGELRLNLSSLIIVREGLKVISPALANEVAGLIQQTKTGFKTGNMNQSLQAVKTAIDSKVMSAANSYSYSKENLQAILKQIVTFASTTSNLQYELAEQCVMAVAAITANLSSKKYASQIDALYKATEDEEAFNPAALRKAASALGQAL